MATMKRMSSSSSRKLLDASEAAKDFGEACKRGLSALVDSNSSQDLSMLSEEDLKAWSVASEPLKKVIPTQESPFLSHDSFASEDPAYLAHVDAINLAYMVEMFLPRQIREMYPNWTPNIPLVDAPTEASQDMTLDQRVEALMIPLQELRFVYLQLCAGRIEKHINWAIRGVIPDICSTLLCIVNHALGRKTFKATDLVKVFNSEWIKNSSLVPSVFPTKQAHEKAVRLWNSEASKRINKMQNAEESEASDMIEKFSWESLCETILRDSLRYMIPAVFDKAAAVTIPLKSSSPKQKKKVGNILPAELVTPATNSVPDPVTPRKPSTLVATTVAAVSEKTAVSAPANSVKMPNSGHQAPAKPSKAALPKSTDVPAENRLRNATSSKAGKATTSRADTESRPAETKPTQGKVAGKRLPEGRTPGEDKRPTVSTKAMKRPPTPPPVTQQPAEEIFSSEESLAPGPDFLAEPGDANFADDGMDLGVDLGGSGDGEGDNVPDPDIGTSYFPGPPSPLQRREIPTDFVFNRRQEGRSRAIWTPTPSPSSTRVLEARGKENEKENPKGLVGKIKKSVYAEKDRTRTVSTSTKDSFTLAITDASKKAQDKAKKRKVIELEDDDEEADRRKKRKVASGGRVSNAIPSTSAAGAQWTSAKEKPKPKRIVVMAETSDSEDEGSRVRRNANRRAKFYERSKKADPISTSAQDSDAEDAPFPPVQPKQQPVAPISLAQNDRRMMDIKTRLEQIKRESASQKKTPADIDAAEDDEKAANGDKTESSGDEYQTPHEGDEEEDEDEEPSSDNRAALKKNKAGVNYIKKKRDRASSPVEVRRRHLPVGSDEEQEEEPEDLPKKKRGRPRKVVHSDDEPAPRPQGKQTNKYKVGANETGGRVRWTKDEDEALLFGLEALYYSGKLTTPWAKILERHGVHGTDSQKLAGRNVVQLKDRARNIAKGYAARGEEIPEFMKNIKIPVKK